MAYGTSGPAGVPALPPAPMGPCREPESVTAPLTEALNAEESGWRLLTASSENVQVRKAGSNMDQLSVKRQKKKKKTIVFDSLRNSNHLQKMYLSVCMFL